MPCNQRSRRLTNSLVSELVISPPAAALQLMMMWTALLPAAPAVAADHPVIETIVLVRHGEKPALGLGQLSCQGLNRALALPAVIGKQFGRPDAILAPDPAQSVQDHGQSYNYVRPLATIEPTAIAFGLPVDASIGVDNLDDLQRRLEAPIYRGGLVVVAWEHINIAKLTRLLMADHGGDPAGVPDWPGSDFDSLYVIRLTQTDAGTTATFDQRHEGLDGQPTACPGQPPGLTAKKGALLLRKRLAGHPQRAFDVSRRKTPNIWVGGARTVNLAPTDKHRSGKRARCIRSSSGKRRRRTRSSDFPEYRIVAVFVVKVT
jgi:hypothetical protein